MTAASDRDLTIRRIRELIQRRASPRLHMSALVMATAAIGFFASYLMLKAGLTLMAVRYPLAVIIAYGGFLGLVSVWLRRFRLRERQQAERTSSVDFDIVQVPFDLMGRTGGDGPDFGGGGGFSGSGASRAFDGPSEGVVMPVRPSGSGGGKGGGGFDLDFDGDGIVVVVVVGAIAAISLSVLLYVVYIAPALFAELLLDAGLAAGLYKRLSRVERRSWLTTAVRNTAVPAMLVAGLLALAGAVMQGVYPEAVSIGRVVERLTAEKSP